MRLGENATRTLYLALVVGAFASAAARARPSSLLALAAVPLAAGPCQRVRRGAVGPALVPVLQETARLQLGFGVLLALGVWWL